MTRHLLLISLGPVQDFIHTARRCQDLWYGSTLLSTLARDVARELAKEGCTMVFPAKPFAPAQDGAQQRDPVANKIQVIVENKDPRELAIQAENTMRKRLHCYAETAFEDLKNDDWVHLERAFAHVDGLIELDWVSVPLSGYGGEGGARAQAERLLAARKNTKLWEATEKYAEAGVPKSSLDGVRESVLHEELYKRVEQWKSDEAAGKNPPLNSDTVLAPQLLRKRYHVKSAERLCGIGLLKRIGSELELDENLQSRKPETPRRFHSTSHAATGPWRAALSHASSEAQQELDGYLAHLEAAGIDLDRFRIRENDVAAQTFLWAKDGSRTVWSKTCSVLPYGRKGYDGYLLYEGRLQDIFEQYLRLDEPTKATSAVQPVKDRVSNAQKALARVYNKLGRPGTYYALLLADGDSMGVALSALEAIGDEQDGAIRAHQKFSNVVSKFSLECREIVERHAGSLIFAGGDDVLALVPLHTAIACARALHDSFDTAMAQVEGLKHRPTLSVGLGIAHHMDDMAEARELAKRAEKLAKQFKKDPNAEPSKNALGIVVSKRSGGDIELVGSWEATDDVAPLDERLAGWCRMMHDERISSKTAFDLEGMVAPFFIEGPSSHELPEQQTSSIQQVVHSLAKGLLGRKRRSGGAAMSAQDRELLEQRLAADEETTRDSELLAQRLRGRDLRLSIRQLSAELQVARLFTRALQHAFPETDR